MTLAAEFLGRFSDVEALNLTNPNAPSPTSVDTTRLGYACTDAAADFVLYVGVAFDLTVASHVTVAVDRVAARLLDRRSGGARDEMSRTRLLLEDLGRVTARGRVLPRTSSVATPTTESPVTSPDFDRSRFRDFVPGEPPGGNLWGQ